MMFVFLILGDLEFDLLDQHCLLFFIQLAVFVEDLGSHSHTI